MNKAIAIIAGEPNSIASEIIFKSWKLKKKFISKPLFIIGSIRLLNLQMKQLNYNVKIKEVYKDFKIKDLIGNQLPVYNVEYNQKKPFEKISNKSNKYIFKCFDIAHKFLKNKKIIGFINCPVSKESLFEKKHQGITEFLSRKENKKNNGVMLLYNKNLSVSPMTTHIPLSHVSKEIDTKKIVEKIKTINNFYKKIFNKKPNFAILGLNPHNFYITKKSREKKIIDKAIKKLNKLKINVKGPIPADSVFSIVKKYNFNVLIGMYHDQVLAPFKALYNFNAINITLGLSYIRISPDHGTAENIAGKNIANPESLVQSIKFFSSIK